MTRGRGRERNTKTYIKHNKTVLQSNTRTESWQMSVKSVMSQNKPIEIETLKGGGDDEEKYPE